MENDTSDGRRIVEQSSDLKGFRFRSNFCQGIKAAGLGITSHCLGAAKRRGKHSLSEGQAEVDEAVSRFKTLVNGM